MGEDGEAPLLETRMPRGLVRVGQTQEDSSSWVIELQAIRNSS